MAVSASRAFMTNQIVASGDTIYNLLVAQDNTTNWPKACAAIIAAVVSGTVTLSDGVHAGIALGAGPFTISSPSMADVYLDQMHISGGGTLGLVLVNN